MGTAIDTRCLPKHYSHESPSLTVSESHVIDYLFCEVINHPYMVGQKLQIGLTQIGAEISNSVYTNINT